MSVALRVRVRVLLLVEHPDGRLGAGPYELLTNHLLYCLLLGVGPRRVEESDQTHESPSPLLVCARHCDAAHAAARVVVDLVKVGLGLGLGLGSGST